MVNFKFKKIVSNVNLDQNKIYGKFSIFPLKKGSGITLGNALRRILLSDLAGIAITAVKIKGIDHEFSHISGIREDVLEILLNLKQIVFAGILIDETILELNVLGPKIITANDIKLIPDLTVVNPNQYIAVICNNMSLQMHLKISSGTGYKFVDRKKKQKQSEFIELDALFMPILKVNYYVEKIYVESSTFQENLIFEIWTNGSILPELALKKSAELLINLLSVFLHIEKSDVTTKVSKSKTDVLLEDLNLSVRTYNCLKREQIHSLEGLIMYSRKDLKEIKNFGQKSLLEVTNKLQRNFGIILKN